MILRVSKEKGNYAIMRKDSALADNRLSLKAKGLWAYLMTLPDDWQIYQSEIIKHCSDGEDSFRTAMYNLVEMGYVSRSQLRNEKGQLAEYEYKVYELCQKPANLAKTPETGIPDLGDTHATDSFPCTSSFCTTSSFYSTLATQENESKNDSFTTSEPSADKNRAHHSVSLTDEDLRNVFFGSSIKGVPAPKKKKKINLSFQIVAEWKKAFEEYFQTEYVVGKTRDFSAAKSMASTAKDYLQYYENKNPTELDIVQLVSDCIAYSFDSNEFIQNVPTMPAMQSTLQQILQRKCDEYNKRLRNSNQAEISIKIGEQHGKL